MTNVLNKQHAKLQSAIDVAFVLTDTVTKKAKCFNYYIYMAFKCIVL